MHEMLSTEFEPSKIKIANKSSSFHFILCNTNSNHGFLNHLHNFDCWADRIGLKFLVFAMDEKISKYLDKRGKVKSFFWEGFSGKPASEKAGHLRSDDYNLIANRKLEATLAVMMLGYDIIFVDVDIAILRDPIPYLLFEGVEYVHSVNEFCPLSGDGVFDPFLMEGNTGFYYARSTSNNIKIWTEAIAAIPLYPGLDDQTIFWNTVRNSKSIHIRPLLSCPNSTSAPFKKLKGLGVDIYKNDWITCGLDVCLFSSGAISEPKVHRQYREGLERLGPGMTGVTVHANFMSGGQKKEEAMTRHGFWLYDNSTGTDENSCMERGKDSSILTQ